MKKNREQGNSGNRFSRESNLRNSRLDSGTTGGKRRYEDFGQQRRDNRRNAGYEGYDNYDAEFDAPFNNRRTEEDRWPGSQEDSERYRHDGESANTHGYQSEGGPWYDRDRMSDRRDWNDLQNQAGRWNDRGSWDPRSDWNREQGRQWNDNSRWYPEGEWRNMQDEDTWNNSFQSKGRGEGYGMNEYYDSNRRDNNNSPSYYSSRRQDMGQHRGKGPKGYTRADERIIEDINDRLTDDSYVDAENIEVAVNGGEVVLSGTVTSKEEKRRAEDIAESISGVRNVENRLRVSQGTNSRSTERESGSVAQPGANGQSTSKETKNRK